MEEEFSWSSLDHCFRKATNLPGACPDSPDWWTRWRRYIAGRASPRWFYSPEEAPEWFRKNWPLLTKRWIAKGELLLEDLTHSDFHPMRRPNGDIDWGANPTKSTNWAGFHYWTWANPLIRSYGLTRTERFPREFSAHLQSFHEQMDNFIPGRWHGCKPDLSDKELRDWVTYNDLSAGAKMVTFSEAVMVFKNAENWTPEDLRRATLILLRIAARLFDQYKDVRHTADFLRTYNFLTTGASGLGTVAAIFPECSWSTEWAQLARDILESHLVELFYPDGGHRELCTQYHKTGMRDILFYEQVLAAQGKGYFLEVEPYRSRFLKVMKWLTSILQPDGTTAVLNSAAAADDWLIFLIVANRRLKDPELAWHIDRWFRPDYVPRQKVIPALCVRIIGIDDVPDTSIKKEEPKECSILLPESGIAVLRDGWRREANVMVLDFGRPSGGHAFPARSCFTLYLRGKPAAMSPGSPHAYSDPDYREWMHTSLSQNTVLIDGLDQEEWISDGRRRVHGEILRWEQDADTVLIQGKHEGYLANSGIVHIRSVMLVKNEYFLVYDFLDASGSSGNHAAKWSIQCPEEMREDDGKAVLAAELMRITPAWPERISGIEFSRRGKAVWPELEKNGFMSAHRQLYQARWCASVEAGGSQEFLMLLQPDSEPAYIERVYEKGGMLAVEVTKDGVSNTFSMPRGFTSSASRQA